MLAKPVADLLVNTLDMSIYSVGQNSMQSSRFWFTQWMGEWRNAYPSGKKTDLLLCLSKNDNT